MFKKIIIIILFIFLITNPSYALTNNDLQAPSGLHKFGTLDFIDEKGHNIQIINYTDSTHKTWFENNTGYNVQPYSENNSFYIFVDMSEVDPNSVESEGILEIIAHDGDKYIVASWTPNGSKDADIVVKNLMEFNKINNLTPIKIG